MHSNDTRERSTHRRDASPWLTAGCVLALLSIGSSSRDGEGIQVRGTIYNHGAPVGKGKVKFHRKVGENYLKASTEVATDGTYAVVLPETGPFWFHYTPDDDSHWAGYPYRRLFAGTGPHDLHLNLNTFTGRVERKQGAVGPGSLKCFDIRDPQGAGFMTKIEDDGAFRVTGIPSRTYTWKVEDLSDVEFGAGIVQITEDTEKTLKVVPGVAVEVALSSPEPVTDFWVVCIEDRDGWVQLERFFGGEQARKVVLPRKPVTLIVAGEQELWYGRRKIRPRAGAVVGVPILRFGQIVLELRPDFHDHATETSVSIVGRKVASGALERSKGHFDDRGRFVSAPHTWGKYTITVEFPDGRSYKKIVVVDAGQRLTLPVPDNSAD